MTKANDIPPGFVETKRGPFMTHNGPVYHKIEGDRLWNGFRVLPRHCNGQGIVHGGWLASFADGVLGAAVWRGAGSRAVTLRLNVDYIGMVRAGEWVEGVGTLTKATRSLAFARAEVVCGERKVATAEGVFKLMGRSGLKPPR